MPERQRSKASVAIIPWMSEESADRWTSRSMPFETTPDPEHPQIDSIFSEVQRRTMSCHSMAAVPRTIRKQTWIVDFARTSDACFQAPTSSQESRTVPLIQALPRTRRLKMLDGSMKCGPQNLAANTTTQICHGFHHDFPLICSSGRWTMSLAWFPKRIICKRGVVHLLHT